MIRLEKYTYLPNQILPLYLGHSAKPTNSNPECISFPQRDKKCATKAQQTKMQ